eukprot:gene22036-32851_t
MHVRALLLVLLPLLLLTLLPAAASEGGRCAGRWPRLLHAARCELSTWTGWQLPCDLLDPAVVPPPGSMPRDGLAGWASGLTGDWWGPLEVALWFNATVRFLG